MLTKRDLGVSFLAGTGFGLISGLFGYVVLQETSPFASLVVLGTGVILAVLLSGSAWWLQRSDLPSDTIWVVAQWSAIGLGISTAIVIPFVFARGLLTDVNFFPSLVTNVIAAGGIVGLFVGVTADLRAKYRRLKQLNEQNSVLHRTLRHDIRNDMSVIKGHAELILDGSPVDAERSARIIQRKVDSVVQRAHNIRVIDTLMNKDPDDTVDLWEVVESVQRQVEANHPAVSLSVDWPDWTYVPVPPLTRSVVDNLVENAIQHNDRDPEIAIDTRVDAASEQAVITVSDNGPGIPDGQLDVLDQDRESVLIHGNGLGLWLVKWVTEYYDGALEIQRRDPRGSSVTVRLPLVGSLEAGADG